MPSSVDAATRRIYTARMEFTGSETKRTANLKARGLDSFRKATKREAQIYFDAIQD